MELYIFFDLLTILISSFFLVKCLRSSFKKLRSLFFLIFFVFYVLPLYFDYIFGFPQYETQIRYSGFALSYKDELTRIFYDVFIVFSESLLLKFGARKDNNLVVVKDVISSKNSFLRILLFGGMIAPFVLSLILPVDKRIIFSFMWREKGLYIYDSVAHTIEDFSYIGVCCSLILFFEKDKFSAKKLILNLTCVLFLFINMCAQGKRSIVFFSIISIIVILFPGLRDKSTSLRNRKKQLYKIIEISIVAVFIMLLSSLLVKVNERGYDANNFETLYLSTRIDFFKDDRVRMAIFSYLNPQKLSIVPFIGATIFPIITWFWPISKVFAANGLIFPSYQDYFSAALQNSTFLGEHASFMTTCMPAELISNFGLFGFILFPVITLLFNRLMEKFNYPTNVFLLIFYVALQMYTIKYLNMLVLFIISFALITAIIKKTSIRGTLHNGKTIKQI